MISERKKANIDIRNGAEEGENIYAFAVADEDADGISIRFDLPGSFSPILSNAGALENRSDYGTKGVLLSVL